MSMARWLERLATRVSRPVFKTGLDGGVAGGNCESPRGGASGGSGAPYASRCARKIEFIATEF